MRLPINSEVLIPVWISSDSTNILIANMEIMLATNNSYITTRYTTGIFYDSLARWDLACFNAPDTSEPQTGYTSQTLLGIYYLGDPPNPPFHPTLTPIKIAEYRMRTSSNSNLIGQIADVFSRGYCPYLGSTQFGDTSGGAYNDIHEKYNAVLFVGNCTDSNLVGTGIGVLGNQQNHIDTYCFGQNDARLFDVTRRANYNPHNHNGAMGSASAIITSRVSSTNLYPGIMMSDSNNIWNASSQAAGVDAHVYAGMVYDYMLSHLNRNGFDSVGSNIKSSVDALLSLNGGSCFDPDYHIVAYGIAISPFLPASGAIDITAHEWAHGITHFCSNLRITGEAGALMESFSDMFGVTVGFATNDPNWLIGEHVWPFNRNLAEPNNSTAPQPNTYHGLYWDQNGDHYINMGVPNKMFYLLAVGGDQNGIHVAGIGIDNAMKVMYKANRENWDSTATFYQARFGSIKAALDIDPSDSFAHETAKAWGAVGVGDSSSCSYLPGDVNGDHVCRGSDVTRLVSVFKGISTIPDSCYNIYFVGGDGINHWFHETGDCNGDCQITGGDVTFLVRYFKGFGPGIRWCPYFTPPSNYR